MVGIILIVVCTSARAYIPIDQSGGWEVSLNGDWRFMLNGPEEDFFKPDFDVSGWAAIKVPGNWEVQGFEGLKEHWEMIETYDRLCGAFIWNWSDQGLRRKTTGREILTDTAKRLTISSKESTVCADVWLDAKTVLDSHGGSGSDGIVYADRFPQVDYWITRKVKLLHADSGTSLLEGPIVRVGRTPVMAEWRNYPRYNIKFWENPLLQNRKAIESTSSLTSDGGVELKMKLDYPSLDKNREGESILVDLRFHISPQGWINVDYELTPQNATGNFLDFGLAFKLPGAMKHLTWVGDGPYNSYPGQTDAAERGIWHIAPRPVTDPESRYYEGNRANVDLAAVTDGKGNGIGVICNGSTVSLEEREGQQIFSQVLRSSGKGNKTGGMMTLLPVKAAEVKGEKGTMRFVPLEPETWPALFEKVLGPVAKPYTPY